MLGGMAASPELDPRYDPAFQRGFDGTVRTGERTDADRTAAPRVTSALQRSGRGVGEPRANGFDELIAPPPAGGATSPARTASGSPDADAASAAPVPTVVRMVAPAMRAPWTNPFAILVTLAGIGALAGGVWMMQEAVRMVETEGQRQTQADYWFIQWSMIASPIFVGLGALVLIGVLMLCAVYWGRRPEPEGSVE